MSSAAQDRELRLRTIKGLRDLLRSAGSMSPERDALFEWVNARAEA